MFRPPRKTPTDREPPFSAPRPRAGEPSRSWSSWRALESPLDDPLLLQCREQALYRTVPGPAVEPLVDGDPLVVALQLVPPRGSRAARPQQGVDERVVVDRHVAALARQQMRDPHEPVKRDVIPRRTHTTISRKSVSPPYPSYDQTSQPTLSPFEPKKSNRQSPCER